jgi:hypothetical protein
MTSTSSASGLLGLSSQARQEMDSVTEDIATLKKHWGWLSDVASAASLLLTQKFYYPRRFIWTTYLSQRYCVPGCSWTVVQQGMMVKHHQ